MPRIAKPITTEIIRLRGELASYLLRAGASANAFSHSAGVAQPTISRFLGGRTKGLTPAVKTLLDHAGIDYETGIAEAAADVLDNPKLREVLQRFCGGRPESTEVLIRLIDALGPVVNSAPSVALRSSK